MGILYPMITFPYASRILLSDGIGKVEFANSISTYFLIIANLGIASYASRELARIRDSIDARNKFAREMFFLNAISTIIAYALMLCAIYFVSPLYSYRKLLFVCSVRITPNRIFVDRRYSITKKVVCTVRGKLYAP